MSQIFIKDLTNPDAQVQRLIPGFDADYVFVGIQGDEMFFVCVTDASRRVVAVKTSAAAQRREVIAEGDDGIESASLFGDRLIVTYLKDARSAVSIYSLSGDPCGCQLARRWRIRATVA